MKIFKKSKIANLVLSSAIFASAMALSFGQANATTIKIEITNMSATGGLYTTPYWLGFDDGNFSTFSSGSTASAGLEAFAEDGNSATLRTEFSTGANAGAFDTMLVSPGGFPGAPIFDPGETAYIMVDIDELTSGYFSFLSMILPSNDAFIGNSDSVNLFDGSGNFIGLDMIVMGGMVYDAGTEVNTEFDAAFFNQTAANTGVDENGVVGLHPGFLTGGEFYGGTTPAGTTILEVAANFTQAGFQVARITITQVSEPAMLGLLSMGFIGMVALRRRKSSQTLQMA